MYLPKLKRTKETTSCRTQRGDEMASDGLHPKARDAIGSNSKSCFRRCPVTQNKTQNTGGKTMVFKHLGKTFTGKPSSEGGMNVFMVFKHGPCKGQVTFVGHSKGTSMQSMKQAVEEGKKRGEF